MRPLFALLLLSSCMSTSRSDGEAEAQLAAQLEGRTAGAAEACISAPQGRSLQIVSGDTLVYRQGRTIWVNRLSSPCLGLRPDRQLAIEASLGGRFCRNDRIRAIDLSTNYSGQTCPLGDFIPYRVP